MEFYVASQQSTTSAGSSPINFDLQIVNCNCIYNNSTSIVKILETGLYWFHFSAGVPNATRASVRLNGVSNPAGIFKNNTAFANDQATGDTLQWVSGPSSLSLSTDYSLYSGQYKQVAWLGFRIDTIMNPLVAFLVARDTPPHSQPLPPGTQLAYNRIIVNEGNAWQASNNSFVVPFPGVYVFAFTTPSNSTKESKIWMYVNSVERYVSCLCEAKHNDVEYTRVMTVVSLNASDIVSFHVNFSILYSDAHLLMSVQGFYYQPISNRQVVWSVNRGSTGEIIGPITYLSYPIIFANVGNTWDENDNKVHITTAGTYLVDLNAYFCGSKYNGTGNLKIQAMLNSQPIIDITIPSSIIACISRSRSVLYPLRAGDTLWVTVPTNSGGYFSYDNGRHSFAGFLLY